MALWNLKNNVRGPGKARTANTHANMMSKRVKYVDHSGRMFASINAISHHYGVSVREARNMVNGGMFMRVPVQPSMDMRRGAGALVQAMREYDRRHNDIARAMLQLRTVRKSGVRRSARLQSKRR